MAQNCFSDLENSDLGIAEYLGVSIQDISIGLL